MGRDGLYHETKCKEDACCATSYTTLLLIACRVDGCCRHILAPLYEVIDFKEDQRKISVTSGPCLWMRRATADQNAVLLTDIITSSNNIE